jgi:hypothetical protein
MEVSEVRQNLGPRYLKVYVPQTDDIFIFITFSLDAWSFIPAERGVIVFTGYPEWLWNSP